MWLDFALDQLADAWVAATPDERLRMEIGIETLNRHLAVDPTEIGESREAGVRFAFIPLLCVRFRILVPERIVRVIGISRYGR